MNIKTLHLDAATSTLADETAALDLLKREVEHRGGTVLSTVRETVRDWRSGRRLAVAVHVTFDDNRDPDPRPETPRYADRPYTP